MLAGVLYVEHENALGSGALTWVTRPAPPPPPRVSIPGLTIPNDIVARSGSSGLLTLDAASGRVTWNGDVDLQRTLTLDNGSSTARRFLPQRRGSPARRLSKISAGEIILSECNQQLRQRLSPTA